ncbi:uncharacterized protein CLUP02_14749 [Colletotrichum lupini]|uniref:Uncharacterized protein n=1 Tax=Colletotrichum lupini TaxID=145971 RepID=A0A9Q8T4T8_9PEZI|nr:uncharacterized protein CLUP02_14749 [Colletotrichum lupini]UQC89221.1 hypothetical protein CLUP02_14749 [Colletotrichum lupini]
MRRGLPLEVCQSEVVAEPWTPTTHTYTLFIRLGVDALARWTPSMLSMSTIDGRWPAYPSQLHQMAPQSISIAVVLRTAYGAFLPLVNNWPASRHHKATLLEPQRAGERVARVEWLFNASPRYTYASDDNPLLPALRQLLEAEIMIGSDPTQDHRFWFLQKIERSLTALRGPTDLPTYFHVDKKSLDQKISSSIIHWKKDAKAQPPSRGAYENH